MNIRKFILVMILLGTACGAGLAQMTSLDTGTKPYKMAKWDIPLLTEWGRDGPWLCLPSVSMPQNDSWDVHANDQRVTLNLLKALGFKTIMEVRFRGVRWNSGARNNTGISAPVDLREVYQRSFSYGKVYGKLVTAFEIENEPDIGFFVDNAETYEAFLKASYLGLKKGSEVLGEKRGGQKDEGRSWRLTTRSQPIRPADRGLYAGNRARLASSSSSELPAPSSPLVVMAPMALPPGPYFEQLVANGLFSYTDAFNYHYYGYAEDFTGVYRQFETAVRELSAGSDECEAKNIEPSKSSPSGFKFPISDSSNLAPSHQQLVSPELVERAPASGFKKRLPVLLTEYGYGLLDENAGGTVAGRVRQWRWFITVADQIRELRVAAPMAFRLPPLLEREHNEFGLTMAPRGAEIPDAKSQISNQVGCGDPTLHFMAGGLTFRPEDFGATRPEPWMRHIGRKFGRNEATPALAWMFEAGKQRYTPHDWTINAPRPSPIVIDFVADDNLQQVKRYGGYLTKQQLDHGNQKPDTSNQPPAASSQSLASRNQKLETSNQLLASPEPVERAPTSGLQSPVSGFSDAPLATGSGTVVLYNFADAPITGRIEITEGRELLGDPASLESTRSLGSMDRIEIPVQLQVPAENFIKHPLSLRFVPEADHLAPSSLLLAPNSRLPASPELIERGSSSTLSAPSSSLLAATSVFSTAFYPEPAGMPETVLFDFTMHQFGGRAGPSARHSNEALTETAASGTSRPTSYPEPKAGIGIPALQPIPRSSFLATEEPRLEPLSGTRWRTTPGVNVAESPDGTWQFSIKRWPDEPLRPAMAELDLPDDFVFPDGGLMRFSYRLRALGGGLPTEGAYFEPYFRTANGNLYQVWPRQQAGLWWQSYAELKENYTMAFFGRANLPWRFAENRVVSLVFFFRPSQLPATFEIKQPRIVKLGIKSREY